MKKFLLALILVTLSFPALATEMSSQVTENPAITDSNSVDPMSDELAFDEEGNAVSTEEELARHMPYRSWICVAIDRHGHRFMGRGFVPGMARRMALMSCRRATMYPWARGCHIVRCFHR